MEEAILHLGKRLRYLRRLRNLTQAQLAEQVGLSVNYVSQIETGVANPKVKTLFALAQGLDVEIRELFEFGEQGIIRDASKKRKV